MFLAMKSRKNYTPPPPCPCGGKCRCHKPSKDGDIFLVIIGLVVMFMLPLVFIAFHNYGNAQGSKTIYVGDERCNIRFKQTGVTSTGAPYGHDEVICPSWQK